MTHTHVGRKPNVAYAYRSSRLYGHDTPKPGRSHALNREDHPQLGTRWRSLCGEVVHDNGGRDEFGDAVTPNVRPAPGVVTCKRCLRMMASA